MNARVYTVVVPERRAFSIQLGEVLRQERESQGMSQRDCALLLGIEPSKLCRWERGLLELSTFQLLQWSRVMGRDVGQLVTHAAEALEN